MCVTIKQATISDIDLLMKWRIEVLKEVFSVTQIKSELVAENRNYYEKALCTGEHVACFAYDKNEIVGCGGMCLYSEMPSPDNKNGKCAYIMNVYTLPTFRQNGIGKKIVSFLIEQARRKNITKIFLETAENAKNFYKELGFVPMNDYLKLAK